jgi:hypothetical protein
MLPIPKGTPLVVPFRDTDTAMAADSMSSTLFDPAFTLSPVPFPPATVHAVLLYTNNPLFHPIEEPLISDSQDTMELESMVKKRRKKMHRHKYRKRLKRERVKNTP